MRASHLRSLLLLAFGTLAVPAPAQVASSLEARAEFSSGGAAPQEASIVSAALRMDRPRLSLSWDAEIANDAEQWRGSGALGGAFRAPAIGPLQLSVTSALSNPYRAGADRHYEISGSGRASLRFGAGGVWAGMDVRRVVGHAPVSSAASPALGAWRQIGPALLTLQLAASRARAGDASGTRTVSRQDSTFNDSLGRWVPFARLTEVTDSTRRLVAGSWSDAEARLFWARGRLTLDAAVGGRFATAGADRTMWAELHGLYAITPRFAIVAGGGSEPADPLLGWARRSFATFGVRVLEVAAPKLRPPAQVRPVPAGFQLLSIRGMRHLIRVRAPHAHTVEVSADFTDWRPIALTRVSPDWWQASADITPGTHHVNIRVNGERWTAPPGVPAVEDEFNGTVGLVVVE